MTTLLSLSVITSVKDYIEIAHKLIEVDSSSGSQSLWLIQNYTEFGAFLTYFLITLKQFCIQLFSFHWLKNIWSLPVMVPEIASAMVSEISVLDGFFHNAFTFLDTPLSYGQFGSATYGSESLAKNFSVYAFEKFFIGFINSFFLFLPTSTAHIITIRRFVMQGLEAGYVSALGTIAGNFLWLCSIIFGWRFFVIPWLSFDIFRYVLGFILLVKYMWDCSKERRMVLQDLSKVKIFLLNFLLALTEQTSIYPFISNLSISPDGSMLETSPLPTGSAIGMGLAAIGEGDSLGHFIFIHACYLLGILIGSLSVLKFTCWFWENPAFNLYMWVISSYLKNTKMTTSYFYKVLNFTFLYLTMICAVSSIGYFGLDYTLTNPLGFIAQDRLLEQPEFGDPTQKNETGRFFPELSHLSVKPTDKNSRTRSGVRGRRERWKDSLFKYQMVDSSLYDQSMYSFLTVEDLNYGFDRFWLRRKMRNHKMNLRLLPGPLVRGLKKQLNPDKRVLRSDKETTPTLPQRGTGGLSEDLESSGSSGNKKYAEQKKEPPKEYEAKGVEFFRLLFEQYYHPNFHKVFNQSNESNLSKRVSSTSNKVGYSDGVTYPNLLLALESQLEQPVSPPTYGSIGIKSGLSPSLEQNFNLSYPTLTPKGLLASSTLASALPGTGISNYEGNSMKGGVKDEFSALRKFTRNFNTRIKSSGMLPTVRMPLAPYGGNAYPYPLPNLIPSGYYGKVAVGRGGSKVGIVNKKQTKLSSLSPKGATEGGAPIYSKKWKTLFSKLFRLQSSPFYDSDRTRKGKKLNNSRSSTSLFRTISKNMLSKQQQPYQGHGLLLGTTNSFPSHNPDRGYIKANSPIWESTKKTMSRQKLSKKDRQILRYRTLLKNNSKQDFVEYASKSPPMLPTHASHRHASLPEVKVSMHALKFYLQKEEAFKRKLKFYGASVFRKLSVGNNAPFFKTMMKRFFYYYKPTLRYKRTLQSASLNSLYRQAPRKKSRLAKKLTNVSRVSSALLRTPLLPPITSGRVSNPLPFMQSIKVGVASLREQELRVSSFTKPTHSYSVLGKKASRYRSQIYRDVLQHWYYTPFNRLLLKLDIDAFMSRQPRAHFLTQKEEHLLHQRRFLLAEHFDTVRWYTYMQHYSSMKTKIGGTKSFSSGIYNQQFQGTFKKIRHLFAITPTYGTVGSQTLEQSAMLKHEHYPYPKGVRGVGSPSGSAKVGGFILKFDQPLFNEYNNTRERSMLNSSVNHEELENMLLAYTPNPTDLEQAVKQPLTSSKSPSSIPTMLSVPPTVGRASMYGTVGMPAQQTDLISESSNIVGNYLFQAAPIRQQFLAKLLKEKDYWQLTQFMFQGEPLLDPKILHLALPTAMQSINPLQIHDSHAATGNLLLNTDSKSPKLNSAYRKYSNHKNKTTTGKGQLSTPMGYYGKVNIQQQLWVQLLRQNKRHINDREYISNYVSHRINITELRNEEKQAQIQARLSHLNLWFNNLPTKDSSSNLSYPRGVGLQKSTKEALDIFSSNNPVEPYRLNSGLDSYLLPKQISQTNKRQLPIDKTLQKLQLIMGKVKNAISFLTSPIRALDKQKRTLAWWRKKQQTKYESKSNFQDGKWRKPMQIGKMKKQYAYDVKNDLKLGKNRKYQLYLARKNIRFLRSQRRQLPKDKNVEIALGIKETYLRLKQKARLHKPIVKGNNRDIQKGNNRDIQIERRVQAEARERRVQAALQEEDDGRQKKDFVIPLLPTFFSNSHSTTEKQRPAKIKTSLYSKMQSSIHQLFTNFFTVKPQYKPEETDRYRAFGPYNPNSVTSVLRSRYLYPYSNIPHKESQPTLLEHVKKLPPTPQKRNQQKYGLVRARERTSPDSNLQGYTRRDIQGMGKLRILIKKIQRLKSNLLFQMWWWQHFLPNYQAEVIAQQQHSSSGYPLPTVGVRGVGMQDAKYKPLSTLLMSTDGSQAKSPNKKAKQTSGMFTALFPQAENVLQKIYANLFTPTPIYATHEGSKGNIETLALPTVGGTLTPIGGNPYGGSPEVQSQLADYKSMLPYIKPVNPLPFYAGWDESLRKLVITNRFLSRRQAGQLLQPILLPIPTVASLLTPLGYEQGNTALKTSTGVNGLNEGSYLYNKLDMPFNAYVIEQFNGRAQTFYAPLGWRRFQFRHSILKTWFSLSPSLANQERNPQASQYFSKLAHGYPKRLAQKWMAGSTANNQAQKNMHRRIKKRFSLMANEEGISYEPTGALLTEVLPSHYLSINDNQYRSAASRYLDVPFADLTSMQSMNIPTNSCLSGLRSTATGTEGSSSISFPAAPPRHATYGKHDGKTAKNKIKSAPDELKCLLSATIDGQNPGNQNNNLVDNGTILDFTLRKRIKTERKYHRQRTIAKNGLVFPRRRKFVHAMHAHPLGDAHPFGLRSKKHAVSMVGANLRWRPSSFKKLRNLKQEKNKRRATVSAARLKQLRPKDKQQILIPAQRFQPRQGGFVWPGQYLLMEFTYLPKDAVASKKGWTRKQHDLAINLNNRFFDRSANQENKPYKPEEVIIPSSVDLVSGLEGGTPRKYLIEKHNVKVLKKKLEKAYRSNKLQERVKQLNYMLSK